MAKKIILVLILLVLALAGYLGFAAYRSYQNQPERVAARFFDNLAKGDIDAVFASFSERMQKKTDRKKQQWTEYLNSFKNSSLNPVLSKQESIKDQFNTYAKESDPLRLRYEFRMNNRNYVMILVLVMQGDSRKIDSMQSFELP